MSNNIKLSNNIDWDQFWENEKLRKQKEKEEAIKEAQKTEKFESHEKTCVICKVNLLMYWKKRHEDSTPYTKIGKRLRSWWEFQGQHCPNCGLKYEFAVSTGQEDSV